MIENKDNDWYAMSDIALMAMVGSFLKEARLQQNKTQTEVALSSGISRSTLVQMENEGRGTLLTFIEIMRNLEQLHLFRHFQIQHQVSPIQLAKLEQNKRKRAGYKKGQQDQTKTDW